MNFERQESLRCKEILCLYGIGASLLCSKESGWDSGCSKLPSLMVDIMIPSRNCALWWLGPTIVDSFLRWWTSRDGTVKHWIARLCCCRSAKQVSAQQAMTSHKLHSRYEIGERKKGGKSGIIVNWNTLQSGIKEKGVQCLHKWENWLVKCYNSFCNQHQDEYFRSITFS